MFIKKKKKVYPLDNICDKIYEYYLTHRKYPNTIFMNVHKFAWYYEHNCISDYCCFGVYIFLDNNLKGDDMISTDLTENEIEVEKQKIQMYLQKINLKKLDKYDIMFEQLRRIS